MSEILRVQRDAARVAAAAAERREQQALRREYEASAAAVALERAADAAAAERGRVAAAAAALEAKLAEANAALEAAAADREQAKEAAAAAATQAQLASIGLEKECAAQIDSLEDEHRRKERLSAAERDAIAAANHELWGTVAALEDKVDRLSGHRVSGLMSQVQEQGARIAKLSARRTLNQRTVSDANLADRRAKMYKERADKTESQLRVYSAQNLDDDANAHAAHVAQLREAIAALTARVEKAEAERDEAAAQVERLRRIAEPPKEKFMAHGSYTVAVDALGLELTASCSVSPNACPRIFMLFAQFFGINIPSRVRRVRVTLLPYP